MLFFYFALSPPQEPYDDDDRARQLALGTMMLRKHRAKEMVDAAYNRFSWNDDADLPDWFVDDEKRHHRPQVRPASFGRFAIFVNVCAG